MVTGGSAASSQGERDWGTAAGDFHSGIVADVLDELGIWGALDPAIVGVNGPRGNVLARAYTVRWRPTRKSQDILAAQRSTWSQVKDFLAPEMSSGAGRIYVGGAEDGLLRTFALAGGFSSTDLQKRGFAAMVLGGAIRDAHVVKSLDMPVWATNFTPVDTQGNYQVAEAGTWCRIGNVTINTGDWIFADESGVLVVPQGAADEVFGRAAKMSGTEGEIERRASAGEDVFDIVAEVGHL
jgi:regulator of RNase E activity RraA